VARPGTRAKNTAKTVLLAEQDEAARTLLEEILQEQGFKVILADGAERCLFLALQRDIDAFLVSVDLPGGDAAQLCTRLRRIARYNLTPIILTATPATSSSLLEAFDAGADDFLEKPINPVIATARLRGHLQRMTYLREMESVRANLNRYVSTRTQQVVEDHAATGALLEPEERVVSVLFSDVRGFTTLSREMTPGALFRMLSRHLAMQVDCVYRHGGYVDKFGGDGIMAVFDTPDGVLDACQCALEIMEATRLGHSHDGLAVLPLGIGLNLGPVLGPADVHRRRPIGRRRGERRRDAELRRSPIHQRTRDRGTYRRVLSRARCRYPPADRATRICQRQLRSPRHVNDTGGLACRNPVR
jgi:DNA-binding response OmpR family regulator